MNWIPWVALPLTGGLIGWATNWVALKMLFHPRKRRFGLQGLLPRRQQEIATSVGEVVGNELVLVDDLLAGLDGLDLEPHLAGMLDQAVTEKIEDLRKIPLVGGFITEERVAGIKHGILRSLVKRQPLIIDALKQVARSRIDVAAIARSKLAAFDLDRLERIVRQIASKEFRAIEWWGFLLGALIGVIQAAIAAFT